MDVGLYRPYRKIVGRFFHVGRYAIYFGNAPNWRVMWRWFHKPAMEVFKGEIDDNSFGMIQTVARRTTRLLDVTTYTNSRVPDVSIAGRGPPDIPGKVPMPDFMFEHPTDEEIRLARLPRGH